jgi:hypothetical protein
MPLVHLRHPETGAVLSVEVPPTGLSVEYLRAGWQEFTPEPEPEPEPADEAPEPPAEPVKSSPAPSRNKPKE